MKDSLFFVKCIQIWQWIDQSTAPRVKATDPKTAWRGRVIQYVCLAGFVITFVFAAIERLFLSSDPEPLVIIVFVSFIWLIPLILIRREQVLIAGRCLTLIFCTISVVVTWSTGGLFSPSQSSFLAACLAAVLFVNLRAAFWVAGLSVLNSLLLLLLSPDGLQFENYSVALTPAYIWMVQNASQVGVMIFISLIASAINKTMYFAYRSEEDAVWPKC